LEEDDGPVRAREHFERYHVIYICIPAHNEKRTIGVLLWKIRNVMAEIGRDFEIPLEVRYDLRNRPSRVRPMEALMGLYRMRRQSWDLSAMRGEA